MSATTAPVAITCPSWCARTADEHRAELEDWGGRIRHEGEWLERGGDSWRISSLAAPTGQPCPPQGEEPVALEHGDFEAVTLDEAEQLAHALIDLVRKARA